jgi:3-phosphoglycerate kinase
MTIDAVKKETERYVLGDDQRFNTKPVAPTKRATNVVDVTFTTQAGLEIILYDAEGAVHRSPITPAGAANLIRRLAGYLATHHEAAL